MTHDQLRRSYRPKQVRLLFVGESPPASGRFFYARDSGLYRAMLQTFATVDPAITDQNFLPVFQASGSYLVDLCPVPVDRLFLAQRRAARQSYEATLTRAIIRLRPKAIATLLRAIEGNVAQAIRGAKWKGTVIHLPYPGRWEHLRIQFHAQLTPVVERLLEGGAYVPR